MSTPSIIVRSSDEKLSIVFERTYASPLHIYNTIRNGDIWTVVECPEIRKSGGYSMRYSLLRNGSQYHKAAGDNLYTVLSVVCDYIQAWEK